MARLRFSTVVHIAVCVTLVAACAGSDQRAGSPADATANRAFRVALLTPGPITDQSWNGGAYEGLMRIRDSLDAGVSHIQTRTPAEFEENFRQYGVQGYSVVFGHGFEFQDAAMRVAPSFPRTIFITTSGNVEGPNLAGMRFAFEEPSYLAGIIAGSMTRTNVIGAIGGTELPPVKESFESFAAGAKSVNPAVKVVIAYIGSWDDASAGKEQALAQISRGVDMIFQNADAAGLGVFQAARESGKAYVFGSNANQNHIAPEVTLASVVIDLPHAFLQVTREIKAGHFPGQTIELGSASNVVQLVVNPVLASKIPPSVMATVDSVQKGLIASSMPRPAVADTSARD
ncbi:MAG: BMP family protein [Gemmatimonadaceae bacterium]